MTSNQLPKSFPDQQDGKSIIFGKTGESGDDLFKGISAELAVRNGQTHKKLKARLTTIKHAGDKKKIVWL
jgi:hypothetical protein